MPDPFRGHVPDGRLYDPRYDMWVCPPGPDGTVRVGATAFGLHLAGEVIMFTGKPRGASVDSGRGLGTVETGKTILAVHSPVGLTGLRCNAAAEDTPALINRAPYGEGWLAVGHPADWPRDREHLVDAHAYVAHVLSVDPGATVEVTNG